MTAIADLTFEQQDEFSRKPIAEKVIKLLTSDIKVSPLVIDGGWGTGKTYFCHKLINLINETCSEQYRTVYVDAFKADHADEPLMTLLAAILSLLPEPEQKTLREKALPALRVGLKTSLKAAVGWVLKQDAADIVENFEDELKDASNEVIDSTIESLLKDHEKAEQSIQSLKAMLQELTKEKKIIVFVDELDRCRPDFAVAMLENIKHIFDVEGVQFVLVTNTYQLCAAINHRYGQSVDAQRYLDKFIGFSFEMPTSHIDNQIEELTVQKYLQVSIANLLIFSETCLQRPSTLGFFKYLIAIDHLSLRDIEQLIKNLTIYQTIAYKPIDKQSSLERCLLVIFSIFVFTFRKEIVKSHLLNNLNVYDLTKILGHTNLPSYPEKNPDHNRVIAAMLIFSSDQKPQINRDIENNWFAIFSKYRNTQLYDLLEMPSLKFVRNNFDTLRLYENFK